MRKSILPFSGVLAGMGFLIISNVCMADEPSVPGFPQGGMDPYAAEPLPPQDPTTMGMPMPMDPSQGIPSTAPGMSQPPQMPPASDEEFPAAASTDKRKVQRFMGRIRAMEMRMAALERRLAMLERGGGTGGGPGGMPGGRHGGMQGGQPGMMQGGQPGMMQGGHPGMMPPGQPGHFGGKVRPRGLSEEEKTDTGSSSEQPASSEPGSSSK